VTTAKRLFGERGTAGLNQFFRFSEREIFLQGGIDIHFCKSAGVLPVVSRGQHSEEQPTSGPSNFVPWHSGVVCRPLKAFLCRFRRAKVVATRRGERSRRISGGMHVSSQVDGCCRDDARRSYPTAALLVHVLKAGDDLTRENLMKQVTNAGRLAHQQAVPDDEARRPALVRWI
jgi:hypothetical protein